MTDILERLVTRQCNRMTETAKGQKGLLAYNLWRQVLEYFDAYLVGLTATPSKQTFGFFNQNLVMEYNHERSIYRSL
jgi:hypothetical protein